MPYCACFHDYTREPDGRGRPLAVEDAGGLLPGVLHLSDGVCSQDLLNLLQKKVIVGLKPQLDECYALGPYTVKSRTGLTEAHYGFLLSKAKYWKDSPEVRGGAQKTLAAELARFVARHPRLSSVKAVTAPPSSDSSGENLLPLRWARALARQLGAEVVETSWKVQPDGAQKNGEGNVWDNIQADHPVTGDVLAIDDALESGDTLRELGKALRQVGARRVYGLCIAKTMKGIQYKPDGSYGIDLSEERWS